MSVKKSFIKSKLDKKLKRLDVVLRYLILVMTGIVLYDSFIHDTPLRYVLFFIAGWYLGKLFTKLTHVERNKETNTFQLKSGWLNLVITFILLSLRFFAGKYLLESFHVIWATDALYLFFIGIYRAKWKGILQQIDDLIYENFTTSPRK
jgi:hypothetical protein